MGEWEIQSLHERLQDDPGELAQMSLLVDFSQSIMRRLQILAGQNKTKEFMLETEMPTLLQLPNFTLIQGSKLIFGFGNLCDQV